jgi:hypothetical protein
VEALLLTCAIDAKEGRDVATVDIPGAFMQAYMDDEIIPRNKLTDRFKPKRVLFCTKILNRRNMDLKPEYDQENGTETAKTPPCVMKTTGIVLTKVS